MPAFQMRTSASKGGTAPPRQGTPSAQPSRTWLYVALLIGRTIVAYLNSFSGQFIIDDKLSIVQNQSIRGPLAPNPLRQHRPPTSQLHLRPQLRRLGGLNPASYHAFNLLIHILAGLVLFGLLRRTPIPSFDRNRA